LLTHTIRAALKRCQQGASENDLGANLVGIVIYYSNKNHAHFLQTLSNIECEVDRRAPRPDTSKNSDKTSKSSANTLRKVLLDVRPKIVARVAKMNEQEDLEKAGKKHPSTAQSKTESTSEKPQIQNHQSMDSKNVQDMLDAPFVQVANSLGAEGIQKLLKEHPQHAHVLLNQLSPEEVTHALTWDLPNDAIGRRLAKDFEKLMKAPLGREDPEVVKRLQQSIGHFSHEEHLAALQAAQQKAKEKRPTVKEHVSKFQEELTTGDDPSPPPYSANEGRARAVKVKQVPVNTPQIQDLARAQTQQKKPISDGGHKFPPSQAMLKMRKELHELSELSGFSQTDRIHNDIDLVLDQFDMNAIGTHINSKATSTAPTDMGKGFQKADTTLDATTKSDITGAETKKGRKKRTKARTAALGSPYRLPPFADQLSEREEVIRVQLSAMKAGLDLLCGTPPPGTTIDYGIPLAFDGIILRLVDQLDGHLETALLLSELNEWSGLKTWIGTEFKSRLHKLRTYVTQHST
jgi:hypothetical protein